jgi:hypothetical protein
VVESFQPLARAQLRELESEVERIAHSTCTETALVMGTVEARPHM